VKAASYSAGGTLAEGFVQAFLVVPGHQFGSGQLDVVDALPRFTAVNQLGLVGGVDRLGEGVVITLTARSDRRGDAEFGQPVGICQR
jgi:hypothetical protein